MPIIANYSRDLEQTLDDLADIEDIREIILHSSNKIYVVTADKYKDDVIYCISVGFDEKDIREILGKTQMLTICYSLNITRIDVIKASSGFETINLEEIYVSKYLLNNYKYIYDI